MANGSATTTTNLNLRSGPGTGSSVMPSALPSSGEKKMRMPTAYQMGTPTRITAR